MISSALVLDQCLRIGAHSLVGDVEDLLFPLEATVGDFELRLVERLSLVEVVSVGRPVHVSVKILLSLPGGAVPQLTVTFITAGNCVRPLVDLQLGRVLECDLVVTAAPVGLVVAVGAQVARTRRRRGVVLRLMVGSGVEHSARAVPAAANLHSLVVPRDQLRVEPIEERWSPAWQHQTRH